LPKDFFILIEACTTNPPVFLVIFPAIILNFKYNTYRCIEVL